MKTQDKFRIFKELIDSELPNTYLDKLKTEAILNQDYILAAEIRQEQVKIQSEDWSRRNK